jgi:hypothetical protein
MRIRIKPRHHDALKKKVEKAGKKLRDKEEKSPTLKKRRVLNRLNHDPSKQINLDDLVVRIVTLAQVLAEKKFYAYQVELAYRIVQSLLLHDGNVITSLMSRQSGKTEVVSGTVAAIALVLPAMAKKFPEDWRLNITDDNGAYRGFALGVKIGIYAPRREQASIMFERVKKAYETDSAKKVLKELGIDFEANNGDRVVLKNGSVTLCQSASEQSKIEGATHHLLIAEEAQDISDLKIRKSLSPMLASTLGTMVMIGTATTQKCDFYSTIKHNERIFLTTGLRNHFFFPYTVAVQYNSLYSLYIDAEKLKLGENSDEFRMSYCCEWIFERGMFVTQEQLFDKAIAMRYGIFSKIYHDGLPPELRYYSLVAGIDWGRSHDSTVITIVAVDWNNPLESRLLQDDRGYHQVTLYKKHIIEWIEFQGDNYEYQFGEIYQYLSRLPQLKKIVTDSNTCGQPIFDRLATVFRGKVEVEPFNFQPRVKSDGYRSFYADICGKRLTFPADQDARRERDFQKFVNQMLDLKKEYKNSLMTVAHPEEKGAHDDFPDSGMLACWGAGTPATGAEFEVFEENFFIR